MVATLRLVAAKSILVVEDDKGILQGLQELLEDEGYTVYTATNGLEALRVLRTVQHLPSVIILDLSMPITDGYEFRAGQRSDPKLSPIPVILMTAGSADIGIEQKDQERIFKRFERASPVSGLNGLGLGLYIVRQIVEAHGASITVESQIGKGSKFTVDLPLKTL